MTNELIKQSAFHFSWEKKIKCSSSQVDDFQPMREWQKRAFDDLQAMPFMILNAPMGSGKSWLMCLLSAYKMKSRATSKTLISIPQTIIAQGFVEANLLMPNGEKLHWSARHNLCHKETIKGTVKYLIQWLSHSSEALEDRILICTHSTLVKAFKKIKEEHQLHLFNNLLVWIDEAHHVKNISMQEIEEEVISNGIGEIVRYATTLSHKSMQLGLTTASFFRGDRCSLLTQSMERLFKKFSLPYDEYLQSMENLETFSFDFLLCGQEYSAGIGKLVKERKGKDIIYIPQPNSRYSTGDKYQEVKAILSEYQKEYSGNWIETVEGLNILQGHEYAFKLLDLVEEENRSKKKEFLNNTDLKKKRDSLDAIVALGMFKEGANWIWADRCIIVGARASLVDVVQMMGRLLRDAKDKKHVEVVQLLPFSLDQQNENFQDNLNNYLKVIYSSLILEDVLNPVKISAPFEAKNEKKNIAIDENSIENRVSMGDLIPDESTRLSVIDTIITHLVDISAAKKEGSNEISSLYDEYQSALPEILDNHGISTNIEAIGAKIWGMLLRRSLKMQGINVEDIDIALIQKTHPLEGLLRYTSGSCGVNTLKKLRAVILASKEAAQEKWNRYYELLLKFVAENGHSRVPSDYIMDNLNLGSWVSSQRKEFRNNQLTREKKEKLESIQDWAWDILADNWQRGFEALKLHFEDTKQPAIPENKIIDGINLFNWATIQRKAYKNGKMSLKRQEQLESLPFWYWDYSESRISKGRDALMMFLKREGHLRVPTTHKENNFPLGVWIKQCKDLYIKGELPREDADYFESLPQWSWEDILEQAWQYGYSFLKKFVETYGHAQPRSNFKIEGFALATWVKSQRDAYAKGLLSDEKAEMLMKLPGWSWQVFEDRNKQGFDALDAFVKREGHALVPSEHIENGFKLGKWVTTKRLAANNPNSKHKLTEAQRTKLESYPWWYWNGDQGRWERGKYFLLKFCEREGHSRVKNTHIEDGYELGRWIGIWRYQYKKKTLSQDKITFFESLPNWSWDVKADQWSAGFEVLKRYTIREGHAAVPANHLEGTFALGTWVATQKYAYSKGKLSKDKILLLEELPGWVWKKLDASWDQGYQHLEKFAQAHGHANVPAKYLIEGYNLGTWVQSQRYTFKKGRLSQEKIAKLEEIPGWAWQVKKGPTSG